jgi:hypothetical protein
MSPFQFSLSIVSLLYHVELFARCHVHSSFAVTYTVASYHLLLAKFESEAHIHGVATVCFTKCKLRARYSKYHAENTTCMLLFH